MNKILIIMKLILKKKLNLNKIKSIYNYKKVNRKKFCNLIKRIKSKYKNLFSKK